jgi:hypothetical protein
MAVTVTSITKKSSGQCQHYVVVVDDNGTERSVETSLPEILNEFQEFQGGYKMALLLAWLRYQREVLGLTPAQMVGKTVVS